MSTSNREPLPSLFRREFYNRKVQNEFRLLVAAFAEEACCLPFHVSETLCVFNDPVYRDGVSLDDLLFYLRPYEEEILSLNMAISQESKRIRSDDVSTSDLVWEIHDEIVNSEQTKGIGSSLKPAGFKFEDPMYLSWDEITESLFLEHNLRSITQNTVIKAYEFLKKKMTKINSQWLPYWNAYVSALKVRKALYDECRIGEDLKGIEKYENLTEYLLSREALNQFGSVGLLGEKN